jgi:lipopolysaccharide export system permease protein
MKTIDLYILRKTLWPLGATIAIALAALLMERLVRLLDLLVNQGGPLFMILKLLANLIPHYLGIALPAAFFVGVLLATMRMSANSELEAIHSIGIGLQRLLLPIMGLAVVLVVCSSIIIGFLQPYTRYAYRALVYSITNSVWDAALERGAFFTGFGGTTIMIDDISDAGRRLNGIFVHEEKPGGGSVTTTAGEGRLFRSPGEAKLILSLEHGVLVDAGEVEEKAVALSFDQFNLPLDLAFDSEAFRARGEGERELTLFELWDVRDHPPPGITAAEVSSELHARLVRIASLLFLPFLAIPLGLGSRRSRRGVSLAVGLLLVIVYHHILQFGESLVDLGRVSPWIGLWLPFGIFAALSGWAFYAATVRPDHNPFRLVADRIEDVAHGLRSMALRLRGAA